MWLLLIFQYLLPEQQRSTHEVFWSIIHGRKPLEIKASDGIILLIHKKCQFLKPLKETSNLYPLDLIFSGLTRVHRLTFPRLTRVSSLAPKEELIWDSCCCTFDLDGGEFSDCIWLICREPHHKIKSALIRNFFFKSCSYVHEIHYVFCTILTAV